MKVIAREGMCGGCSQGGSVWWLYPGRECMVVIDREGMCGGYNQGESVWWL